MKGDLASISLILTYVIKDILQSDFTQILAAARYLLKSYLKKIIMNRL